MRRRFFTILSLLSFLLCAASAVLWARSWRRPANDEDRVSLRTWNGERVTIRSFAGELFLFSPPPGNADAAAVVSSGQRLVPRHPFDGVRFQRHETDPRFVVTGETTPASWPTAREAASALKNEQVIWWVVRHPYRDVDSGRSDAMAEPAFAVDSPAYLLADHGKTIIATGSAFGSVSGAPPAFSKADATAALLPALDDPERFAIAHLLLQTIHTPLPAFTGVDAGLCADRGGLKVQFRPLQAGEPGLDRPAQYDAGQMAAIRDSWHRKLDVHRGTGLWWPVTAGTAVLPFFWLTRFLSRYFVQRSRRRAGCCICCGYDLRESPTCCPECGTVHGLGAGAAGVSSACADRV